MKREFQFALVAVCLIGVLPMMASPQASDEPVAASLDAIPQSNSADRGQNVVDATTEGESIFKIVPLKNADAEETAENLTQLGLKANIVADRRSNSLLIRLDGDREQTTIESKRIDEILTLLDEAPSKPKRAKASDQSRPGFDRPKDAPTAKPQDSNEEISEVKVFSLENADAGDCVRLLKDLYPETKCSVDHRTNALIAVSSRKDQLQIVEALLMRLDESDSNFEKRPRNPKSQGRASESTTGKQTSPASGSWGSIPLAANISGHPEAQKLMGRLTEMESTAAKLAESIRRHQKEPETQNAELEQMRKKLDEVLGVALDVKFKLEQIQLTALEERIARVKAQIAKRTGSTKQIIERRARELIEGDALRWTPNELGTVGVTVNEQASRVLKSDQSNERVDGTRILPPGRFVVDVEKKPHFLNQYPRFSDLSFDTTEQQFRAFLEQQKLVPQLSIPRDGQLNYSVPLGDGNRLTVMFGLDGKCRGIEPISGKRQPDDEESKQDSN